MIAETLVDRQTLRLYHQRMKRIVVSLALVLVLAASTLAVECPDIRVYFSPKGGCTEEIVKELHKAQKTVLMQAYSFTSKDIAEALVAAKKRGVDVQAILDKSVRKQGYTEADFLAHANVKTLIDAKHAIAHNKVMVIDDQTVITGSFNFTKAAETSNAENLLIIRDKTIADKYTKNWKEHEKHSESYDAK